MFKYFKGMVKNQMLELMLFYPIVTSLFWLIGSLFYFFIKEIKLAKTPDKNVSESDRISFLVPCYNESDTIAETIETLWNLRYPYKELIVVNDGSTDDTAEKINSLKEKFDFTFINLTENKGKANALNLAVNASYSQYVMVVDADTLIDEDAPYYMIENFKKYNNLGAVTGNPRIRNKSTLLGKIQTVEYASIIGSIKRAQMINGFVNTVSGVFTLFDKKALQEIGNFDTDMITEDIAVTWKFHFSNYDIQYEPRAKCWMLVPESIVGLFKQRIRWAQGGQEVLLRDTKKMFKVKNIAMWILYLEQILSIVWVFSVLILLFRTLLTSNLLDYYFYSYTMNLVLFSAFVLTFINIIQFTISLLIDSRYEKKNLWMILYLSWYPVLYWIMNAIVTIVAIPRALNRKKGEFSTWTSPDRGNIKR